MTIACFSNDTNDKNKEEVENLKKISKKYIELFIQTYSTAMGTEQFEAIQKKLTFAAIDDF